MEEKTIIDNNTTAQNEDTIINDVVASVDNTCSHNDGSHVFEDMSVDDTDYSEYSRKDKDSSLLNKIITGIKKSKEQLSSTYTKRNPVVNAYLSIFLIFAIIVSTCVLWIAIRMMFVDTTIEWWSIGIAETFYSLYSMLYMYKFVICNKKYAIIPAFISSTFVWYVIMFFYVMVTTPDYEFCDDEGNETSSGIITVFLLPLILSIIINLLFLGITYLMMQLKKYGATAWTLLDISRGKKPKFEKICLWICFLIWMLPVGIEYYSYYRSLHPTEKYPSHLTAKIGDYYYDDGTVSSELLSDKKPVGIVFSLVTSKRDQIMGFNHGQIVSLTDISSIKMEWDNDVKDYDKYPNYVWKNRKDALKDIDGLEYLNCEKTIWLTINSNSQKYMEDEIKGTSGWYVPTAGQWAKILNNIGKVKVDGMLKFDAETASKNLKRVNINPQRWYWTITEFDAENAWSIRLANGEFGSRSNKQSKAYVRPVASF